MSLRQGRRWVARVGIYLVALLLVLVLFHQRDVITPSYGLRVTRVRETEQLGSVVAKKGEKLLVVEVWLVAHHGFGGRLRPAHFHLLDADGLEHQPDSLSPLFSANLPSGSDQEVKGDLVFRLLRETVGRSLSFHPEVEDHAPDLESEDIGPQSGP